MKSHYPCERLTLGVIALNVMNCRPVCLPGEMRYAQNGVRLGLFLCCLIVRLRKRHEAQRLNPDIGQTVSRLDLSWVSEILKEHTSGEHNRYIRRNWQTGFEFWLKQTSDFCVALSILCCYTIQLNLCTCFTPMSPICCCHLVVCSFC